MAGRKLWAAPVVVRHIHIPHEPHWPQHTHRRRHQSRLTVVRAAPRGRG